MSEGSGFGLEYLVSNQCSGGRLSGQCISVLDLISVGDIERAVGAGYLVSVLVFWTLYL